VQLAARAKTLVLAARRTERLEQLQAGLAAEHPQLQVVELGPTSPATPRWTASSARYNSRLGRWTSW